MYGKYTLFYESPKNGGYYMHAQTVCTRPLLGGGGGGEGPGNEAMHVMAWSWSTKSHFYMKKSALPSNVL